MPNIGGAVSGAATGAGIGSIIPGIGTGIGAAIGGLLGLFRGKKKESAAQPSTGGALSSSLSPELDRMLQQIIAQGQARNARTEPLHQAAMLMASRMAPSWINSGAAPPRLQSAIQSAGSPRPRTSFSPEVMEAIQRLSGRFSA